MPALAAIVDPIMREHFAIGEEVRRFGEDDHDWWEEEGDPLSHHLQEVIGAYLGFEDEVVAELENIDPADVRDGEMPFYDSTHSYVPTPTRPDGYSFRWDYVLQHLKHRRRFFNAAASEFFADVFQDVEKRSVMHAQRGIDESVAWEMPTGSLLCRARICRSNSFAKEAYKEPLKCIGPPPPEIATAGRMNVEGVVVFYGALEEKTCLAETRPAIGNDVAVIQLRTKKPLRLLDFGRLGRSYERLSYFQGDFTEQVERGAFLRRLENFISQPIVPGREMDYLITQTMAEYLAHIYQPKLDGILFRSVQSAGGTNIVLFQNEDSKFDVEYADNSFKLFKTRSVEYQHSNRYVGEFEGEAFIGPSDDEMSNEEDY